MCYLPCAGSIAASILTASTMVAVRNQALFDQPARQSVVRRAPSRFVFIYFLHSSGYHFRYGVGAEVDLYIGSRVTVKRERAPNGN